MTEGEQCPKCGGKKHKTVYRGSGGLQATLWLISFIPMLLALIEPLKVYFFWIGFAVPAIGYTIWRVASRYRVCQQCGAPIDPSWQPTNRSAVAGLVFGLMLHIPLVSGIAALILGAVGWSKSKSGATGGARAAKIALILGVVNVVVWMLVSLSMSVSWGRRDVAPLPPPHLAPFEESNI